MWWGSVTALFATLRWSCYTVVTGTPVTKFAPRVCSCEGLLSATGITNSHGTVGSFAPRRSRLLRHTVETVERLFPPPKPSTLGFLDSPQPPHGISFRSWLAQQGASLYGFNFSVH